MGRAATWTDEHIDYLLELNNKSLSTREMSTEMSRRFRARITVTQINYLLGRMRKPGDSYYRANTPYRRAAKYTPWR